MNKKFLSVMLCGTMTAAMLAGCQKQTATDPTETTTEPKSSVEQTSGTETVKAGEIPQDYKYYYSFDAADNKSDIQPTAQTIGGDPILSAADKDVVYIPGVKGDAVYTDGITGYKLTDVNGVGDNYTVSFWIYATRFSNYMPTVQFGPDIHGDATGGQHYVNITRTEWAGEGTFPCLWSYDELDNALWPAWSDIATGEPLKQWVQIALVVDSNNLSADGTLIATKLYINGQEWITKDSDGNVVPAYVTKNCMQASDNFDFLLGVNYWDSIFKGAFDELYIYDYALNAEQVAALYADGNASAEFVEPERVINVAKDDSAIASIGALDFSKADDVYAEPVEISDGETIQIKLKHWSDGKDAKNNYYFVFKDVDGNEVARVNADMTGTADGKDIADSAFTWSWGNWNTWEQSVMVETEVTANITYADGKVTVDVDNVDYNKTSNTAKAEFEVSGEIASIEIGTQSSYTDILSIKDKTVRATGTIVGNTDCTTAFWTAFSDIFAIPEGESVTKTFTNYTDGVNNWDNFLVVLQNTATGHSATEAEGYAEYAVLRADNFGWGTGYETATAEADWNWDTYTSDMDGAKVEVTITNNGATADVVAVVTTTAGTVYTQKYTGITTGGELYACFTCEASYLSFEAPVVGLTDCTTPFWTAFSDIWEVKEGESVTKNFTNYTDGVNNWDNFLVVLQNTATGHSAADAEGYAEYAVLRADNFGWGTGYETATAEADWNWDTYTSDMDGAKVALTVTNNGATADIVAVVTTTAGTVYTQKYTGITTGGDLNFCLTCEAAYLVME